MPANELTPKQARFVDEFMIDLNATQAAKRAGYSELTADVQGPRLLGNVGVAAAIAARQEAIAKKLGVTQERIVAELAKIGFSDIRKAIKWQSALIIEQDNPDGGDVLVIRTAVTNTVQMVASDELDDDTAAAISEVSQTATGGVKIKLHDKKGALVDLGKHLGMFKERVEHTGKDGAPLVPVVNVRLSKR
ncbi:MULTISPECIES: terminase small subunit [unclassified Mesorhizobium]|uniref:terminase small subunit n=1 Tax=unclassified Mesorhizobium TaxID=325217 RepID=UPI000FC9B435|nr:MULTISPECIES: terminase small subunit [unclassified Mesorhizobium]RUX97246.1 terminase small subunit [Mesorhizobium sp. M7D.F.Ca.US.004.01.2.1]RVA35060.1 terminase small subunit [Mesorhizobium sp. M7D.F.Ca.US.004.03.1.1]